MQKLHVGSIVTHELPALVHHEHIDCILVHSRGTAATMGGKADGKNASFDEKALEAQRTMNLEGHYSYRSYKRIIILAVVLITTPYLLVCVLFTQNNDLSPLPIKDVVHTATAHGPVRVPLEAHIMSKCPDAKDCLKDLVVPAMEKVYAKVDFKLSYIGTYVVYHAFHDTWQRS